MKSRAFIILFFLYFLFSFLMSNFPWGDVHYSSLKCFLLKKQTNYSALSPIFPNDNIFIFILFYLDLFIFNEIIFILVVNLGMTICADIYEKYKYKTHQIPFELLFVFGSSSNWLLNYLDIKQVDLINSKMDLLFILVKKNKSWN